MNNATVITTCSVNERTHTPCIRLLFRGFGIPYTCRTSIHSHWLTGTIDNRRSVVVVLVVILCKTCLFLFFISQYIFIRITLSGRKICHLLMHMKPPQHCFYRGRVLTWARISVLNVVIRGHTFSTGPYNLNENILKNKEEMTSDTHNYR